MKKTLEVMGSLTITNESFVRTAPIYKPGAPKSSIIEPIENPQTVYLCEKLGIDDPLQVVLARTGRTMKPVCVKESTLIDESITCNDENPVPQTPMKSFKLSLPAPVTPSLNEDLSQTDSICTPNHTKSDNLDDTQENLSTPPSIKKIFKRRNLALYTPEADEDVSTSTSSMGESESPRTSKLPCRINM